MITSILIANRSEIASHPILPELVSGRWRAEGVTEGSHLSVGAVFGAMWDPSAPSRGHLPVPGRI